MHQGSDKEKKSNNKNRSAITINVIFSMWTGYWLDGRGSIPGKGKRFFSVPQHPDRLWPYPATFTVGTGVKAARS
jgi:hypothetical protein